MSESGNADSGVEAFCRGAGIDPAALPADAQNALLTLAGQMVREVVLGLMDVLKGRTDLKSRLRLSQTTIQPGENNPLKFSASVDEAVLKLLDPHSSRYLGPVEAIRESFTDLRTHQTALVGAIQAAVDELMNRIEPGDLQERFDRGLKRGALLGATNKMKYWELYHGVLSGPEPAQRAGPADGVRRRARAHLRRARRTEEEVAGLIVQRWAERLLVCAPMR